MAIIDIKNIKKSFGKNQVLKGINLSFDEPKIITILGPNGSGKTTLMKLILGMVIPDSGNISVLGNNIKNSFEYRNDINYLPQIAQFPENLTVQELLNTIKDIRQQNAKEKELIELFDLEQHLKKKLSNLSGGTKQKVNIVLAFMYDNPILILDEPTASLDPIAIIRLKELIEKEKEKGKTIFLTTHIMPLVEEMADEIIFLLEGKIYFRGSLFELKEKQEEVNLEKAIAKILIKQEEVLVNNIH